MTEIPEIAGQYLKFSLSEKDISKFEQPAEPSLENDSECCGNKSTSQHSERSLNVEKESTSVSENISSSAPLYERCKNTCRCVEEFLEDQPTEYFDKYLIPEKFYQRFWVMDLVTAESTNTCCFTKR